MPVSASVTMFPDTPPPYLSTAAECLGPPPVSDVTVDWGV